MVWLTGAGVEGTGLGGVRAVKSPPAPTTIAHGVLVGWSAARVAHRGLVWKSARELALEHERWAVHIRCERGYTRQLPDLAAWLDRSKPPGAVIAESGGRREDRQKMILEAWRDALSDGRYLAIRYGCASDSVAQWITRLARKVGLTSSGFLATVQSTAEQIAALSPTAPTHAAAVDEPNLTSEAAAVAPEPTDDPPPPAPAAAAAALSRPSVPAPTPRPVPQPETAEDAAERERRYREILGMDDETPRRRWRRRG